MLCCPAGYIGVLAELIIAESTEYLMNIRSTQEARDEIHNLRHSKPKVWKVTRPQHSSSTLNSRSEKSQDLASFAHIKLKFRKVIDPYYTTDSRSEMLRICMRDHSYGFSSVNDNDDSDYNYNDDNND